MLKNLREFVIDTSVDGAVGTIPAGSEAVIVMNADPAVAAYFSVGVAITSQHIVLPGCSLNISGFGTVAKCFYNATGSRLLIRYYK